MTRSHPVIVHKREASGALRAGRGSPVSRSKFKRSHPIHMKPLPFSAALLTAIYSAELSQAAGGVVNALTKSGANTYHGDVFYYLAPTVTSSLIFGPRQVQISGPHHVLMATEMNTGPAVQPAGVLHLWRARSPEPRLIFTEMRCEGRPGSRLVRFVCGQFRRLA